MSLRNLVRDRRVKHLFSGLALIALVLSLLLPYRDISLAIDSSIFAAVGLHLNHGGVLYRDAWDHKPPVVFFLNALALRLGGESHTAIRDLQTLFACGIGLTFYMLVCSIFRSIGIALFASILFLLTFYHPILFGGGNFTEEYGAFFVLWGVLGIAYWSFSGRRRGRWVLLISGVGFGLAVLTKEPFVLSFFPWLAYVVFLSRGGWSGRFANALLLVIGGLLPGVIPLAYFHKHHALNSWIEVIEYGFQYTDRFSDESVVEKMVEGLLRVNDLIFSNSILLIFFFLLGVSSLSRPRLLRRTHFFPLFTVYWVVFDFAATTLSGLFFLHYYLRMVPSVVVLSASGGSYLLRGMKSQPSKGIWAMGSLIVFFGLIDFTLPGMLADYPPLPKEAAEDPVLDYLNNHRKPGDTLWTSNGYAAKYYLMTGMLSPTRYLGVFTHHLETGASRQIDQSRVDRIYADLTESPPEFMVGGNILRPPLYRPEFLQWLESRYSVSFIGNSLDCALVFDRVEDASLSIREQKKKWASEEAHTIENQPFYQSELLTQLQDSAPQSF